jgi:hypothetical protein
MVNDRRKPVFYYLISQLYVFFPDSVGTVSAGRAFLDAAGLTTGFLGFFTPRRSNWRKRFFAVFRFSRHFARGWVRL